MRAPELAAAMVCAGTSAMACDIDVQVCAPVDGAGAAVDSALRVFHTVDATCSRFRSDSDLTRLNSAPDEWHTVSRECFLAIVEARAAFERTAGRFDPRVLDDLEAAGYCESVRVRPLEGGAPRSRTELPHWSPDFDWKTNRVRVGEHRLDLGGIGKGLATRWAAQRLVGAGSGHLVEAGGDLAVAGRAPDGELWRVAVEHPVTGECAAVLALTDSAVATSSTRVRSWLTDSGPAHHLIDPDTGLPGGFGLSAVTVVDRDPALAEVWTKQLFLAGSRGIAASAQFAGLAALWFDTDGAMSTSPALLRHLVWSA